MFKIVKQLDTLFITIIVGLIVLFIYSNNTTSSIEPYFNTDRKKTVTLSLSSKLNNAVVNEKVSLLNKKTKKYISLGTIKTINNNGRSWRMLF